MSQSLHSSEIDTTWLLTSYVLSGGVATPIAGRLGDMDGKKRTLVWLLGVVAGGTLLCAVSSSLAPMVVGRLISGVASGVFPLSYGIVRDEFPQARVATAIGVISVSVGVGTGMCATIVARQVAAPGGVPLESGFAASFWVCALGLAGACAVATTVPGRSRVTVPKVVLIDD